MTANPKTILITGGAGFIGCELSSRLVARGERVTVLDILHPQVHHDAKRPRRLHPDVTLLPVDVTGETGWAATLRMVRPDCVVHLAAETGTGQSLTLASRHAMVNVVGTTRMTDAFVASGTVPPHVVLASSRAVYGEGLWERDGQTFSPGSRSHSALAEGRWIPGGDGSGRERPIASAAATTPTLPTSVYGVTKLAQEGVLRSWCSAMGSALSILRLQNVYGPGQSLGNSYTGIVTLFARQAREGREIDLYEDGGIIRDFVYVDDVVDAMVDAIDQPPAECRTVDIGSGEQTAVADLAGMLASRMDAPSPVVTGRFRDGDVRAAFADTSEAARDLAWERRTSLDAGVEALLSWLEPELNGAGQ